MVLVVCYDNGIEMYVCMYCLSSYFAYHPVVQDTSKPNRVRITDYSPGQVLMYLLQINISRDIDNLPIITKINTN